MLCDYPRQLQDLPAVDVASDYDKCLGILQRTRSETLRVVGLTVSYTAPDMHDSEGFVMAIQRLLLVDKWTEVNSHCASISWDSLNNQVMSDVGGLIDTGLPGSGVLRIACECRSSPPPISSRTTSALVTAQSQ